MSKSRPEDFPIGTRVVLRLGAHRDPTVREAYDKRHGVVIDHGDYTVGLELDMDGDVSGIERFVFPRPDELFLEEIIIDEDPF